MSRSLKRALGEQKKQTKQVEQEIYGSLGIPLGGQRLVNVPNRQGFVYVKLRDNQNEVIQAFNNQVAASYDLPVIIVRSGNKYTIKGVNTERYQNNNYNSAPLLPAHGTSHSFGEGAGADVTWVFSRQNMPLLVHPSRTTGSIVEIAKHPMQAVDGSWKLVGGTGTSTLLTYRPTGTQAIMALVYMDAQTGNPGFLVGSGTPFDNVLTGSSSIYQYIPRHNPANQIPLAAVRMDTGTYNLGWENLYDLRQWVQVSPTGSASTPGVGSSFGVVGQDEGVFLGTGSVVNFVGAGVTASISGSVIQVSVPGGGGGGGVDQIGVYGQQAGSPLGTGTTLNVTGGGATLTHSGTVLNLSVPNATGTLHNSLQSLQGGTPSEYYHLPSGTFWSTQEGNGWSLVSGTVTFLKSDAPSYEVYLGYNVTGSIGVGMKVGLRHQSQNKFFFVTAVGVTGSNTYLNLYGGTDYTLNVTGAISAPMYSQSKAPFGFPILPSKWTVTAISTGNLSQATPTATQWYNVGSLSISMPIGAWRAYFKSVGDAVAAAAAVSVNQFVSLTTSSASPPLETNTEFTVGGANTIATASDALRLPYLSPTTIQNVVTKTTWYMITKTNAANHTNIAIRGDLFATVIAFECAYL